MLSTEASRPIRDGDKGGGGKKKSKDWRQAPTRKTKAAVGRRQNNKMLGQCPSGIAQRPPHHAIAVPTAMQNSHKDNVHSSAVGNNGSKRSPTLSLSSPAPPPCS